MLLRRGRLHIDMTYLDIFLPLYSINLVSFAIVASELATGIALRCCG